MNYLSSYYLVKFKTDQSITIYVFLKTAVLAE